MKPSPKIGRMIAFAIAAATGTAVPGGTQAAVKPHSIETGGIRSILGAKQATPKTLPGMVQAQKEKLLQFAGNSSSRPSDSAREFDRPRQPCITAWKQWL